jgi:hypothetical protein
VNRVHALRPATGGWWTFDLGRIGGRKLRASRPLLRPANKAFGRAGPRTLKQIV